MAANKPSVLILGGCGFIGRNLVAYLVAKNCCSHIRVVDKMLPSVAFLSPQHKEAFASPIVKFKQGNVASAGAFHEFRARRSYYRPVRAQTGLRFELGDTLVPYQTKIEFFCSTSQYALHGRPCCRH